VFNESEFSWYQKKARLFLYDLLIKGHGALGIGHWAWGIGHGALGRER